MVLKLKKESKKEKFKKCSCKKKCEYCNGKGTYELLLNPVCHQVEGEEPVTAEVSCEECGGE